MIILYAPKAREEDKNHFFCSQEHQRFIWAGAVHLSMNKSNHIHQFTTSTDEIHQYNLFMLIHHILCTYSQGHHGFTLWIHYSFREGISVSVTFVQMYDCKNQQFYTSLQKTYNNLQALFNCNQSTAFQKIPANHYTIFKDNYHGLRDTLWNN
jgi:hypothetical protein